MSELFIKSVSEAESFIQAKCNKGHFNKSRDIWLLVT